MYFGFPDKVKRLNADKSEKKIQPTSSPNNNNNTNINNVQQFTVSTVYMHTTELQNKDVCEYT